MTTATPEASGSRTRQNHLGKWQKRALALLAISLGIWFYYFKPPFWYEEVQLSDGSLVTIRQSMDDIQTFSSGIGDGGGWYADKHQIDANEKLGIKTPWIGLYGPPLVLDRSPQGYWYVISTFLMCEKYAEYVRWRMGPNRLTLLTEEEREREAYRIKHSLRVSGLMDSDRPYASKYFYAEYRYVKDQWVLQQEVDRQHDGAAANLLIGVKGHFDWFYFSVKGKTERYATMNIAENHRNVLLTPRSNCH